MREPFLHRLEKRALVADGAMGTMLYSKGIALNSCFDELNVTNPRPVKEVHLAYLKAGADLIETNTFGANRFRLQKFDRQDKVREFNLAGARLAREVAGEELYVAGAVGPLGVRIEPLGPTSFEEARQAFREQVAALIEGGVDLIVIETMIDLNEAREALLAARAAGSLPVVVQMTVEDDGTTVTGAQPEDFARALDEWGADLIGCNCSVGPAAILETLERMAKVTTKKLSAQPNAGLPRTVDGRNIYLCSPEYMAAYAPRFIHAGARLIGGCCGTTPEHVKAIKAAVRSLTPQPARISVEERARRSHAAEPVAVAKRSALAEKLTSGEFPVLVEVVPPKGCDAIKEIEGAEYLRAQGIDAVNIPDGSGATARMSAQTLALLIQQRVGIEVLLHYSSRDRSLLTIQSDLLGAYALGLRNILAVTADPRQFSANPSAPPILEVDAIGLVNVLNNLNRGLDMGGNPLGHQTSFLIGVGVNTHPLSADDELRRFAYKVEAGANFALTLPVFDVAQLDRFLQRIEAAGVPRVPVIASIWPLTSYRNAEFLSNEVPGIAIPSAITERMRKTDSGDRARAEGTKIAQETVRQVRHLVQGVQIAAPFGRYAMAFEVAEATRETQAVKKSPSAAKTGSVPPPR